MVGYVLGNTMSRSGSVSRGVCTVKGQLGKDAELDTIVENGVKKDAVISLKLSQRLFSC